MQLTDVDFKPLYRAVTWKEARRAGERLLFGNSKWSVLSARGVIGLLVFVALSPIVLLFNVEIQQLSVQDYVLPLGYVLLVWLVAIMYYFSVVARGREYIRLVEFAGKNNFFGSLYAGEVGLIQFFAERGLRQSILGIDGEIVGIPFQTSVWKLYVRTKYGRQARRKKWITARFALGQQLPHMIFDNKKNNIGPISNLPAKYSRSQIDHFEGDLHKFYNIYAPEGYQVDTRTIFTPEVLWQLRTIAPHGYDAEIIDGWLVLYQTNGDYLRTLQPMIVSGILLAQHIREEAANYADERSLTKHAIAKAGKRLRPSITFILMQALGVALLWGFVGAMRSFSWKIGLAVALVGGVQGYFLTRKKFM